MVSNSLGTFSKILVICMVAFSLVDSSYCVCDFEAIFNFGDSNSDTGGFHAAFPAQPSPYGMTYFKKPVGRASDGRLIVDFLGNDLPIVITIFCIVSFFFFFFIIDMLAYS